MGQKLHDPECIGIDYPVWVIGAPEHPSHSDAKHLTLQISPNIGEVYWEHPDEMNHRPAELDDRHC